MPEFLTKDEFHEYVIDNRDRQDANRDKIIETQAAGFAEVNKNLGDRVSKLETENTKQNRLAGAITALNIAFLGLLAYLK